MCVRGRRSQLLRHGMRDSRTGPGLLSRRLALPSRSLNLRPLRRGVRRRRAARRCQVGSLWTLSTPFTTTSMSQKQPWARPISNKVSRHKFRPPLGARVGACGVVPLFSQQRLMSDWLFLGERGGWRAGGRADEAALVLPQCGFLTWCAVLALRRLGWAGLWVGFVRQLRRSGRRAERSRARAHPGGGPHFSVCHLGELRGVRVCSGEVLVVI